MSVNGELSSTTPAAPTGYVNVTWLTDSNGHISGTVPAGGGSAAGQTPDNPAVQFYMTGGDGNTYSLKIDSEGNLTYTVV